MYRYYSEHDLEKVDYHKIAAAFESGALEVWNCDANGVQWFRALNTPTMQGVPPEAPQHAVVDDAEEDNEDVVWIDSEGEDDD